MYYTDEMRLQDFTKAKDLYYQFQSRLNISYSMNMILVLLAKPSCPGYAKLKKLYGHFAWVTFAEHSFHENPQNTQGLNGVEIDCSYNGKSGKWLYIYVSLWDCAKQLMTWLLIYDHF